MDIEFHTKLEHILKKYNYEYLIIHTEWKQILDKFKNKKFIIRENGEITFYNDDVVIMLCYKIIDILDSCGYNMDDLEEKNIGKEYIVSDRIDEYIIITLHKTKNSYLKYKMMF